MGTSVKGIQVAASFEKAATLVLKEEQILGKATTEVSKAAKATAKTLEAEQTARAALEAARKTSSAAQKGKDALGTAQKIKKTFNAAQEARATTQQGRNILSAAQTSSRAATGAKATQAADKGKGVVHTGQAANEMVTGERVGEVAAQVMTPNIGRKLDFVFGKATGRRHNLHRSTDMQRQLNKIGIFDNDSSRAYLCRHLAETLNNPNNITLSKGGCITKESLLMGPNGGLKMESVWIGADLISIKLMG